jgi:hypothetical protein
MQLWLGTVRCFMQRHWKVLIVSAVAVFMGPRPGARPLRGARAGSRVYGSGEGVAFLGSVLF